MTDTPTAPTLRELLDAHTEEEDARVDEREGMMIDMSFEIIDRIEAQLLAPLEAEITTLRTQVEKGSAIINRLGSNVRVNESEINTLRARVAAADAMATEYGKMSDAKGTGPGGWDALTEAWVTYYDMMADDATKTGRKIPISELVGIAPDLTEGLPSEVWLDQMRGAPADADAKTDGATDAWSRDVTRIVGMAESRMMMSVNRAFVDRSAHLDDQLAALRRDVGEKYPLPGRMLSDHFDDLYANDKEHEYYRLQHEEVMAALRRDVDALNNTIGERSDNLDRVFNSFTARLASLESQELPETGEIEVTDAMGKAALDSYYGLDNYDYSDLFGERMRRSIEAALAARGSRDGMGDE